MSSFFSEPINRDLDFPAFCGHSMKSVSSNERRVVDVSTSSSFYCRVQAASSSVGDEGRTVGGGSCSASGRDHQVTMSGMINEDAGSGPSTARACRIFYFVM